MHRSRSLSRVASRAAIVGTLATVVALLASGVAGASTVTSDFESPAFQTGSVNGQQGWKSAPPGTFPECNPGSPTAGRYDHEVVSNPLLVPAPPAAFGGQSLRVSNACTVEPSFALMTYSAPAAPAGEDQANTVYTAQFSFISRTPDAEQPRLSLSVSPSSAVDGRMSWVRLQDTDAGIAVTFSEASASGDDFVYHDAGVLDRTKPHTIKFWIKLNPGPHNDLVRLYIDGVDRGQDFTTWEDYWRFSSEQPPGNTPPSIDRLLFRTGVPGYAGPAPPGGGFLFDNVTVATSDGAGPPPDNLPIVKRADTRTVRAGGQAGYRITIRNRGRAVARNMRVCDHIPSRMTFVKADRKMKRVGRARCFLIARLAPGQRISSHIELRVDRNAPAGTEANIADVTPVEPPGSSTGPSGDTPRPPMAQGGNAPAEKRAKALVKVRARRAGPRPRFTG